MYAAENIYPWLYGHYSEGHETQIPTIDPDVIVHVTMNPKFHCKKAVSKCVQQVLCNVSFLEVSCNQIEFVASNISCVQVYPEQLREGSHVLKLPTRSCG